jgi:hypothetical protein
VGPVVGLDDVEKILGPTGTRNPTSVVQPVASRYNDYAIPAASCEVRTEFVYIM